jgi:putative solute:sodium symporter small subunit
MADDNREAWWRTTRRLAAGAIMVAAALIVIAFVVMPALDQHSLMGIPLGALVASAALPVALSLFLFWLFARQDAIDRRHGFFED